MSCSDTRSENTNTIWSPTISRPNFNLITPGYSRDKNATTVEWLHNTKKTDLSDDVTYYAVSGRKVTVSFTKDATSVSAIGSTALSCEIWRTATDCGDITLPTITCGALWSNGKWRR